MELAQWRLRRERTVLVGAFGRMRMGELIDDAARVVVTLEGIHVGEAWEGRGRRGEHLHVLGGDAWRRGEHLHVLGGDG